MSSSEIIAGLAHLLRSDGLEEIAGLLLKESKNIRMIELALEELCKEADEQLLLDAQHGDRAQPICRQFGLS